MLIKNGAIKFGDFTLTSGLKSKYYVDIKEVSTKPEFLNELAEELSKNVKAKTIAAVELGAVPILIATSIKMNLPLLIIRKEREHGTKDLLIGKFPEGTEVDLIEDVVTTGGSLIKAIDLLRSRGAKVTRAICVVDREQGGAEALKAMGVELIPLVKISSVLK